MNPRTIPPLRLDSEETISGSLQDALDTAVEDELPDEARMIRLEGAVLAAITSPGEASTNEEHASSHVRSSHARTAEWRPPTRARVRFASAKIGLAALVGMGAAWSSVTGYRAYQAAVERTSNEPSPAATQRSTATRARAIAPATKHEIADEGATLTTPQPTSLSNDAHRAAAPTSAPAQGLVVAAPSTLVAATVEEPSMAAPPNPSPKIADIEPARRAPSPPPSLPSAVDEAPPEGPKVPPVMTSEQRELEEDLLERASRALRSDPKTALAVAETHRRSFASGRLAHEREVIAIKALAKLKQLDQARARAAMFLAEHPESPYAKDVSALVAGSAGR